MHFNKKTDPQGKKESLSSMGGGEKTMDMKPKIILYKSQHSCTGIRETVMKKKFF